MGIFDAVFFKHSSTFLIPLFEDTLAFGEETIQPFCIFKHLSSEELVQGSGPRELRDGGDCIH
jgi:hypothetical protein